MYITAEKFKVVFHDSDSGRIVSTTYLPEKIQFAQVMSNDEVVVTCQKTFFVLRRAGRTTQNFYIYQRRPL